MHLISPFQIQVDQYILLLIAPQTSNQAQTFLEIQLNIDLITIDLLIYHRFNYQIK